MHLLVWGTFVLLALLLSLLDDGWVYDFAMLMHSTNDVTPECVGRMGPDQTRPARAQDCRLLIMLADEDAIRINGQRDDLRMMKQKMYNALTTNFFQKCRSRYMRTSCLRACK